MSARRSSALPLSRFPTLPPRESAREGGPVDRLTRFFRRELEDDLVVRGDAWLKESGAQQQLEFEGFQLRWAPANRLTINIAEGWQYVLVSRYLWWKRRVRRRFGPQNQYLLKRVRSFRAMGA